MVDAKSDLAPAEAETVCPKRSVERRAHALQISLSADSIRNTALSLPVWAIIVAALFGGIFPELGETPISQIWPWLVLCTGVAIGVFMLWRVVKTRAREYRLEGQVWLTLVTSAYFAVGATWCLMTLLFWDPENLANHCLLLVLTIAAVSLFMNSQSGSFVMVVAATLPTLTVNWAHFLYQDLRFDTVIVVLLPIWALQLHFDGWRACQTVKNAHRSKLELEALAGDLADARDESARANRSKSLFLANMSHELRTPLNAIIGFSETISTEALGSEAQSRYREYAGDILSSGRHLLSLVNDVLDLAKVEAGKLEIERQRLDGSENLRAAVSLVADHARRNGVTVRTAVVPRDLCMLADKRAFQQIVTNLLTNAIKFTPAGGSVEARLESGDTGVTLRVNDTGHGIPAEQLAQIFQPFEQLDNHYGNAKGGSGLGLALVRALTEMHGGNCQIESAVGEGTLVTVFLPHPQTTDTIQPEIKTFAAA